MRMHRGSSKDADAAGVSPETLPLSASAPTPVQVELEFARAGRSDVLRVTVAPGTSLRSILRAAGQSPEGCAVLRDGRSLPLDILLTQSTHLVVVTTFSGG
jgi:sulfur carrier protein ThiS